MAANWGNLWKMITALPKYKDYMKGRVFPDLVNEPGYFGACQYSKDCVQDGVKKCAPLTSLYRATISALRQVGRWPAIQRGWAAGTCELLAAHQAGAVTSCASAGAARSAACNTTALTSLQEQACHAQRSDSWDPSVHSSLIMWRCVCVRSCRWIRMWPSSSTQRTRGPRTMPHRCREAR
jgi:hypothetical protein